LIWFQLVICWLQKSSQQAMYLLFPRISDMLKIKELRGGQHWFRLLWLYHLTALSRYTMHLYPA
jgi:hypothetical protein